jgi:hypothetical protein
MQSRQFRTLTKTEKKAKLVKALISKTEGRLSQDHLESIVNHRWQLGFAYQDGLAEDFDLIDVQLTINVHSDPKEFAKAATLLTVGMEHSWAGSSTTNSYGNWIVGDNSEFGLHKYMEYSNNGDVGSPDTEDYDPEFDVDQIQVIVIQTEDHDSFNRNSTEHETRWDLHVYLTGEFRVEPEIQAIMSQFNL